MIDVWPNKREQRGRLQKLVTLVDSSVPVCGKSFKANISSEGVTGSGKSVRVEKKEKKADETGDMPCSVWDQIC